MIGIDFEKLVNAVSYWLSYQDRIGRDFMMQESSLRYPFADFLTGSEMPIRNIELEYPHPFLKKRTIDLVTMDAVQSTVTSEIKSAVEFKIVSVNTKYDSERQRIFNDLMRNHLITNGILNSRTYFVIFGKYSDFIQNFRSVSNLRPSQNISPSIPKPTGYYTKWFGFAKNHVTNIDISSEKDKDYRSIYDNFLTEFLPKDSNNPLSLPNRITTKCLAISPLRRYTATPYVGGIWTIS